MPAEFLGAAERANLLGVIGGMLTAPLLSLLVVPGVFYLLRRSR